MFTAGAAMGSVVTWKLIKDKYEARVQEEIDSVREARESSKSLRQKKHDAEDVGQAREMAEAAKSKPDIAEYASMINSEGYYDYSNHDYKKVIEESRERTKENLDEEVKIPYVINPDDYAIDTDYDKVDLTYYADGVVAYDLDDKMMKNVDEVIGEDSLLKFGEYEEGIVYVRNDRLRTDYCVSMDSRDYSAVMEYRPPHYNEEEY